MKRSAIGLVLYYIMGMAIYSYMDSLIGRLLGIGLLAISSVYLSRLYQMKSLLLLWLVSLIACVNLHLHMGVFHYEADEAFQDSTKSQVVGIIDGIEDKGDGTGNLIIRSVSMTVGEKAYHQEVWMKLYTKEIANLHIGQWVEVTGKIKKIRSPMNPGGFNKKLYLGLRGIHYTGYISGIHPIHKEHSWNKGLYYTLKDRVYKIRQRAVKVYDRLLPERQSTIMKAMILGDKMGLDIELREGYSRAGIAHVLAISGLHVALLGYGFFHLVCKVFHKKKAVWFAIVFLLSYCILTGGSVSTIRASLMLIIIWLAYFFGRSYDIYSSLAVVALILLVVNPLYIADIGFMLSFTSVIGIVSITPVLEEAYNRRGWKVISLLNVSIGATLGTMPVILYSYYQLRTYAVLVNILVVPLMTLVVALGFLGLLLGSIWLIGGRLIIGMVYYILLFYDSITKIVEGLPFHTLTIGRPAMWTMMVLVMVIISIALAGQIQKQLWWRWMWGLTILSMLFFMWGRLGPKHLEIAHLYVGQGDTTVIMTPGKQVFIIDGGGSRGKTIHEPDTGYYTIRPYLHYQGISRISGLIMTHSDRDHIGGLMELMDYFPVERVYIPYGYKVQKEQDPLYLSFVQKARSYGIPISYIQKGDTVGVDGLLLETLYPLREGMDYRNNNAYSTVILGSYGDYTGLFTGDIATGEENILIKSLAEALESDIIKVPHHGSKSSSSEGFLEQVSPSIGVMSSGVDNSYGHPHQEIVNRYEEYGVLTYITADDGAVIMKTDGERMGVETYYSKEKAYFILQ